MRTGIFGGTFDPPHLSHLILAEEAWYQLQLERLLFVLTQDPPHKQDRLISPVEDRLAMLQAAIQDNPHFAISRVEIDRPGPHYSVDTVRLLQEEFPEVQLVYLMGGDSFRDLLEWHKPAEFVAACHQIGVMRRPQDRIDLGSVAKDIPEVLEKVRLIQAPLLEVASKQIRRRIAEGRPYRYYLSTGVVEIIQNRGLYQD
ncbi:MAG: nicotinate-nucleotide adenylyltransferase [Anaerolineae bacterium]|nr:nicotinate-nucleotide adenylyltransferase [Anaerolineae bacterium]